MIRALVIDDEAAALSTMQLLLERYVPEIGSIQCFTDPLAGLQQIQASRPDILFLDIQMPVMDGFELLRKLGTVPCPVIFTTAHDQYAIQAIRFSALDYLLKPIDADELKAAFRKFLEQQLKEKEQEALYVNLLQNISARENIDFTLAVPTQEATYFLKPASIIRLEGENNYSRFFFSDRKPLLVSKTLKEYEELLSEHGFIRVHKSHLVNRKHIVNLTADGLLRLSDGSSTEISRRRKEEVVAVLKQS